MFVLIFCHCIFVVVFSYKETCLKGHIGTFSPVTPKTQTYLRWEGVIVQIYPSCAGTVVRRVRRVTQSVCDLGRWSPHGHWTRKQYLRNHGKLHADINSVWEWCLMWIVLRRNMKIEQGEVMKVVILQYWEGEKKDVVRVRPQSGLSGTILDCTVWFSELRGLYEALWTSSGGVQHTAYGSLVWLAQKTDIFPTSCSVSLLFLHQQWSAYSFKKRNEKGALQKG